MSVGWKSKRNGSFVKRRDAQFALSRVRDLFSGCSPETTYLIHATTIGGTVGAPPLGALLVLRDGPDGSLHLCHGTSQCLRVLDRSSTLLRSSVAGTLRSLIGQMVKGPDEYGIYEVQMQAPRAA
jgi:hypothetical protein